jgi:hypothetical protein
MVTGGWHGQCRERQKTLRRGRGGRLGSYSEKGAEGERRAARRRGIVGTLSADIPQISAKAGPTNSSLIGIFRGWNTGNGGIKCGSDERITGGSDDASASIAGIEPRSGYLRCLRWRYVVVRVRYGRRRWSRRIGDWQHSQRWGGTDAARHWNALATPKTPSGRRASQQR